MASKSIPARTAAIIAEIEAGISPIDDVAFRRVMAQVRGYQKFRKLPDTWLQNHLRARKLGSRGTVWRWVTCRFLPHPSARPSVYAVIKDILTENEKSVTVQKR